MDNVGNENIYIYIQEGKLNKFNTLVFVDIQRQWFPTRYNEYKLWRQLGKSNVSVTMHFKFLFLKQESTHQNGTENHKDNKPQTRGTSLWLSPWSTEFFNSIQHMQRKKTL